jgi:hypothetical protein
MDGERCSRRSGRSSTSPAPRSRRLKRFKPAGRRERKIDSLSSDNLVVRAFGDAAVVTGRTTASAGGQTVILRFTDVFVRRDGRWLAVASQATPIVP